MLYYQMTDQQNFQIIRLSGRFDVDREKDFRKDLFEIAEEGKYKGIILNMEDITMIASNGVGMLASVLKISREKKFLFAITNLSQKNKNYFQLIGLDQMLPIFESEQEALETYASQEKPDDLKD